MTSVSCEKPEVIRQLETELLSVLNRHYCVNHQTFSQISPQNMAKHEICHLTKALSKIQNACDEANVSNVSILVDELAPDLIIYALELSVSFDIPWWNDTGIIAITHDQPLLNYLCNEMCVKYSSEEKLLTEARRILVKSVSRLGHFCDKEDHKQDANVEMNTEVILPFLKVSFSIANFYSLDLNHQYHKRLRFVEGKYTGEVHL